MVKNSHECILLDQIMPPRHILAKNLCLLSIPESGRISYVNGMKAELLTHLQGDNDSKLLVD